MFSRGKRDYHEGMPAITVIVDSGWSKRSDHYSYNAKSGVGIIIGQATGKLPYIRGRNSKEFHEISIPAIKTETLPGARYHGFKQAEQVHGVRYKMFVGDGHSSVYPTLIENMPGWGRYIEKLDCANHACMYYRSG